MRSLIRALKVWWIKRQARAAYLRWRNFGSDLSCGTHMAQQLRGQIADNAAFHFDFLMAKLKRLGEDVPETRLSDFKGPFFKDEVS